MMPPRLQKGTWTPTLTFATPGDLSVAYNNRVGTYTRVGRLVVAEFNIGTSGFTHTTASGNCQITGLPFTSLATTSSGTRGALSWGGITKANYTQVCSVLGANASLLTLQASGSGQAASLVTTADMPTGGTVELIGTHAYFAA